MSQSQVSAQASAYVQPQGGEIAEQAAPMANTGPIAWARQNLFGNVTDTLITLVLALLIFWAGWSALSGMFVRANTAGSHRGEGTLAELVAGLYDKLDDAQIRESRCPAKCRGCDCRTRTRFGRFGPSGIAD